MLAGVGDPGNGRCDRSKEIQESSISAGYIRRKFKNHPPPRPQPCKLSACVCRLPVTVPGSLLTANGLWNTRRQRAENNVIPSFLNSMINITFLSVLCLISCECFRIPFWGHRASETQEHQQECCNCKQTKVIGVMRTFFWTMDNWNCRYCIHGYGDDNTYL